MTRGIRLAAVACIVVVSSLAWADDRALVEQTDRQRQIQADTERTVRRVSAMLRVMDYYQLDKSAEKQMLQEVATSLSGLSREQMSAVISKLDAASKESDPTKSAKEVEAAYVRHREIMTSLRKLLAAYDAVKTLEQGAERMEKASRDQIELALQTFSIIQESKRVPTSGAGEFRGRGMRRPAVQTLATRQADEQSDFRTEVDSLLKQLQGLRGQLPADQKDRLNRFVGECDSRKLSEKLLSPCDRLWASGSLDERQEKYGQAFDAQWDVAGDLWDLSLLLRPNRERLVILREARQRLAKSLSQQEVMLGETQSIPSAKLPDAEPKDESLEERMRRLEAARREAEENNQRGRMIIFGGGFRGRGMSTGEDAAVTRARDVADRQLRTEQSVREGRLLLKPHAAGLAEKLTHVEGEMRQAQNSIRGQQIEDASGHQEQATGSLRAVIIELDRLVLEAELQQHDPHAAVAKAIEAIDAIIKDQTANRDATDVASKANDAEQVERQATPQAELAKRTSDVRKMPLPANQKAQAALGQAIGEMTQAAKDLKQRDAQPAMQKQSEALTSLEEARRSLAEQLAAIEQRRQEMAKLEDAAKKVAELARQERAIADQAKDMPDRLEKSQAKSAADKQAELKPPTQDVADQVKDTSPKAAEQLSRASDKMSETLSALEKSAPKPAAKAADEATKKLLEAQKELAKELEKRQGAELADQAAMQPNKLDTRQAAEEIAKALEQANRAKEQSQEAADRLQKQSDAMKDLAKMQKDIADKADLMKLERAAQSAEQAAESLRDRDLNSAMEQQKKALDQLRDAAREQNLRKQELQREQGQQQRQKGEAGQPQREPGQQGERGQQPAPRADELAKSQEELMRATESMARSQSATQAAQAALAQAQANAPQGIQSQLGQASQQLQQAAKSLEQGMPSQAGNSQSQAAESLAGALSAMQAAQSAARANGKQPGQGEGQRPGEGQQSGQQPGQMQAQGQNPGQGQQQGQGQQPGQNQQQGQAQENNQNQGNGNRNADGAAKNAASQLNDVKGDGTFLHLPPKQREMIRQAIGDKLPPEYAAWIQQYYVNIARGKPAAKPVAPEPPK